MRALLLRLSALDFEVVGIGLRAGVGSRREVESSMLGKWLVAMQWLRSEATWRTEYHSQPRERRSAILLYPLRGGGRGGCCLRCYSVLLLLLQLYF